MYDELLERAPAYLDYVAGIEAWKQYYMIGDIVVMAYLISGDMDKAVTFAQELYDHAEKLDREDGRGISLLVMGRVYLNQNRLDKAEECFRKCIDVLKDNDSFLNELTSAWFNLCQVLMSQERYDDALQAAMGLEKANIRYEEHTKVKISTTWVNLWGVYIRLYVKMGDYDKAEIYCDKLENLTNSAPALIIIYKARAQIFDYREQYDKALEMIEKAESIVGNRNTPEANSIRGIKIWILSHMGRAEEAYNLSVVAAVVQDSIRNVEFASRIDELRTQYEVDRHIAEKKRNRNYFLFALGGSALLIILLGCVLYYNRIITKKNRNLYKQIKEQDHLAEELLRQSENISVVQSDDIQDSGGKQQRELVQRLREYMLNDRHLANADINRDEVISVLGTNRTTLSEAVKAVAGKTLMEYIHSMQMDEARRMLESYPELTIESIALDCGFNTPSTFYRLFRKHYGISPSEYRKIALLSDQV